MKAAFYEKHAEDLGMDLLAKPFGAYEDEVLEQAMPPGMAYVGNEKYGRWEQDEAGRRRWSWGNNFLFYYLVFGGHRRHYYYHDGWSHWNRGYRGRAAYYGRSRDYGSYGTHTRNSARYRGSSFGSSGGFRTQDRSVRRAGRGTRGGGPGGAGK